MKIAFKNNYQVIFRFLVSAAVSCFVLLINGCDDSEGPAEPEVTADDYVEQGWKNFELHGYDESLNDFLEAIKLDNKLSDAFNGAGWSSGRIVGKLEEAGDYFAISFDLDTSRYDALGGWVFVIYQSGDWEAAIQKADSLLHRREVWQFYHEKSIDFSDIRLVMAVSYFNLGDFEASLEIVQILNSAFEADLTTPIGRRELRDEIERLRLVYG